MATFTATFSNDIKITRNSDHDYTVAWRASWISNDGTLRAESGFSVGRESAKPFKPSVDFTSGRTGPAKRRAVKANAEFLVSSGYKVEFAEAVKS